MLIHMCYSRTYRSNGSYWNGFIWTLLPVLLVLFTHPAFLVEGSMQYSASDVVDDFYSRYNMTDQIDLVFVLDRSGSISRNGWISTIHFVMNLLSRFLVDCNHVRVAIVTFSHEAVLGLNDLEPGPATDSSTKCTVYWHLRQMMDSVSLGGYTATYDALHEAYRILLNSRLNAKKAVFLLTNSRSNIGHVPQRMTPDLRSLKWDKNWNLTLYGPQLEIYSFGIAGADVDQLKLIASPNPHLHFLYFPNFEVFDQFSRRLREDRGLEQWIEAGSGACGQNCSRENAKCMCGTRTGQFSCACPPGHGLDGLRCKVCQLGYYKEGYVPEPCRSCPQNSTTSRPGASNATACHPLPGQRRCPELPDIQHGLKFLVSGDQEKAVANTGLDCRDVRDGNSCHFECENGFQLLNGSKVMMCNAWGMWDGKVPYCEIVDCGQIDESWANESRMALTYANRTTVYKSVIFASCWPGLVALGPTSWSCEESGAWSGRWNLECKEVFCSPLMRVEFSEMVPPECANTTQRLGFECQMICGDGFRQIGPGNYSCSFEGKTFWKPRPGEEGKTVCRDIQAPVITCPENKIVELDSNLNNCTTVDYDLETPLIYDNSGKHKATYKIIGEPANKTFCIGQAPLTYEAVDQTGNKDTCIRFIIVKEKSGKVISCPDDITMLANSTDRSHVVFWPEPIFHGRHGDPLPFNCSHTQGSEFKLGVNKVVCAPTVPYQGSNCEFKVTISDPPCPLPFSDRLPVNGNTHCGQQTFHVKSCTTECHEGFDTIDSTVPNFFCFWNGSWNLQQLWPQCYRSRRPSRAITGNRIIVTLNSSCTEQKRQKLYDGFIRRVNMVLQDQQGPCKLPCKCFIRNVDFNCSSGSRLSQSEGLVGDPPSDPVSTGEPSSLLSESLRENVTLRVILEGVIKPVNRSVILKSDQRQLYDVLTDVYYAFLDMVERGQFFWQAEDLLVTALEMVEESAEFVGINCESDELRRKEQDSFACLSCPVGTYYLNGTDDASATCVPCPLGFYKDQEGGKQCRPCGQNRNTTSLGARNASECLDPCPPGYSSSTGYEPCSQCIRGTYQTESQSTACLRCPQNQTTQSDGATSLDDCFENILCDDRNRTCGPHGSCILRKGDISCLCDAGFAGAECGLNIDECENSHCQNSGTCIDRFNGYECQCSSSFTGERCEIEVDECANLPCHHGGSCIDGRVSYTCFCLPGYSGSNCQEDLNECLSNPCNNGSCLDGADSFTCTCHPGFTGDRCDKEIDFCVNETCFNGGRCTGSASGTSCDCTRGYTGLKCEAEIDACATNPCLNEGTCSKELDTFHCRCRSGFIGETCERAVSSDFDLVFPEPSVSNYVMMRLRQTGSPGLRQVTVCTWMRTTDLKNYGTIWSYSAESNWLMANSADILTAHDYKNLKFYVNGHVATTDLSLNDGAWHHLCFTWNSEAGDWAVFINGTRTHFGHNLAQGTFINANGFLVLGQEQDSIGGGFDIQESFVGELSQFAIFDTALKPEDIASLSLVGSENCSAMAGNVISWTSVRDRIQGNVIMRNTSWCMDVNECNFASTNVCEGNTRCQDNKGSFSCVPCKPFECLKPDNGSQPCASEPCQNGGTCQPNGTDYQCQCTPEYTGRHCSDVVVRFSCSPNPCQNGGSCDILGGEGRCRCVEPWVSRYCSVYSWQTCDSRPCFNNGTCFPNETHGYRCECPMLNQSLDHNCEIIRPCQASPSPCHTAGKLTCLYSDSPPWYQCVCKPDFTGLNCEVSALCVADCKNGGKCVKVNGIQGCECSRDYKGPDCDVLRNKEVKVYHVIVRLVESYDTGLPSNETFMETFGQQILHLYAKNPEMSDGRVGVKINSIREGSVIVEFDLTHTYYVDKTNPGAKVMKQTLVAELTKGQLGIYKATLEDFVFVVKDVSASSSALYASVIVTCIIIALVISVLLWWYIKRYRPARNMRSKLTNPMRVSNPMYHGDFSLSSPSPQSNIQEDLYCEPRELLPYATSEDSDKDSDPGASCQNKRKKNNWHLRQSIPLPPKPDEAQVSTFSSGRSSNEMNRATPPPPYYPSHGHGPDQPPIPPARDLPKNSTPSSRHNYANDPQQADDSCYFTPLSDEEAELIKHPESVSDNQAFEMESAYLIPRRPAEEETAETIEMTYLAPVAETLATSDEAKATSAATSDADMCNGSNVVYAIRSPSCDAPVSDVGTGTPQQETG